jgi:hypothetical protein
VEAERRRRTRPNVPNVLFTLDLDLKSRVDRHPIGESSPAGYRVLELKGCSESYTTSPKSGRFDEKNDAIISISGEREALIRVTVRRLTDGGAAVVVEREVVTEEGARIPLTLAKVAQVRGKIIRDGRRASAELEAMQSERQRLRDWIAAPVLKPLAERGRARTRIAQLERAIPSQTQLVTSLSAELQVAEAVEELANELHLEGKLLIGSAE